MLPYHLLPFLFIIFLFSEITLKQTLYHSPYNPERINLISPYIFLTKNCFYYLKFIL